IVGAAGSESPHTAKPTCRPSPTRKRSERIGASTVPSLGLVLVRPPRGRTEPDGRRNDKHPPFVATDNLPFPLVHHPVMAVAQQSEVLLFVGSAMHPVHQVVSGRPCCRPLAARPDAVPVANVERLARGS